MIDSELHKPIEVFDGGGAGPYLMVPQEQVPAMTAALRGAGFSFWVGHQMVSIRGGPYIAFIHFRRGAEADRISEVLASAD